MIVAPPVVVPVVPVAVPLLVPPLDSPGGPASVLPVGPQADSTRHNAITPAVERSMGNLRIGEICAEVSGRHEVTDVVASLRREPVATAAISRTSMRCAFNGMSRDC